MWVFLCTLNYFLVNFLVKSIMESSEEDFSKFYFINKIYFIFALSLCSGYVLLFLEGGFFLFFLTILYNFFDYYYEMYYYSNTFIVFRRNFYFYLTRLKSNLKFITFAFFGGLKLIQSLFQKFILIKNKVAISAPILLVKSSSWNSSSSAHFSDPEAIERFEICLKADRVPKSITMIQFPNLAQANKALKVNMGELKGFVTNLAHQKGVVPWASTEQDANPDLSKLIVTIINQLRLGYNSSAEIAAHIINQDFLGPFVKGDASSTVQSLNSSESLRITKAYLRHITTCYEFP